MNKINNNTTMNQQPHASQNVPLVPWASTASSPAATLLHFAEDYRLFHTADGSSFADIDIDGHQETFAIQSKAIKERLGLDYFRTTGEPPSASSVKSAIGILNAKAQYEMPQRSVHLRVAENGGRFYLDLGDAERRVVEITTDGWDIVHNSPISFHRPDGMMGLPLPERGGSVDELKPFLNLKNDDDFVLIIAWAMAAFRPYGPYPVLALSGEQGSAKSSVWKLLRNLIDPNFSPLRALPTSSHDLYLAAKSSHLPTFDNLPKIPRWASEHLCQLATGAGYVTRQLRTDDGQIFLEVCRPIILNGIGEFIDRADLADRSIFVSLQQISHYRPEKELRQEFDRAHPQILGALLDGFTQGLRTLPDVSLNDYPRMADFAKFAIACEPALWKPGTFTAAYSANRDEMIDTMAEMDPTVNAVRELMSKQSEWVGTATNLLAVLRTVGESNSGDRSWLKTARELSTQISRVAPILRRFDIEIRRKRTGHSGARSIEITRR